MSKRLILPGGILWILGLIMSIVGMNIHNDTGRLIAVIGNVLFLIGLGVVGAAWLIMRRNEDRQPQKDQSQKEE
jgi:glucose dehydrogenase